MLSLLAFDAVSAIKAALGIGALIFVHELGHFLVGRLCGVKAEAFSIGFGPPIAKWKPGETEYRLAPIFLGGYVKFAGENPDEQEDPDPRALNRATYPRQVAIMLAGVTMNAIAAFVLFAAAFHAGVEKLAPVVGTVEPGSTAEAAGVLPGDRIEEVDGNRVLEFTDLVQETANSDSVELLLRRNGELLPPLRVPTRLKDGIRRIGVGYATDTSGRVIPAEHSHAERAGLLPGDRVVAVGSHAVGTIEAAWAAHLAADGADEWTVEREGDRVTLRLPRRVHRIGVIAEAEAAPASTGLLLRTAESGAAAEAGLPPRFRLVSADSVPVRAMSDLQGAVTLAGATGRDVVLEWTPAEGGAAQRTGVRPREAVPATAGELGIERYPLTEQFREESIPRAAWLGVERSHRWVMRILGSLRSMVTGQISAKQLQGPIRLGRSTYEVAGTGWTELALFLGILSMNLAVLNVLPIPLLDGGQLVRYTLIRIRRKPLPERFDEIYTWTGLAVVLSFVLFVVVNDLLHL